MTELATLFQTTLSVTLSIGAVVAIVAGVLILLFPKLLNYIVGIYLIVFGLLQLLGRA